MRTVEQWWLCRRSWMAVTLMRAGQRLAGHGIRRARAPGAHMIWRGRSLVSVGATCRSPSVAQVFILNSCFSVPDRTPAHHPVPATHICVGCVCTGATEPPDGRGSARLPFAFHQCHGARARRRPTPSPRLPPLPQTTPYRSSAPGHRPCSAAGCPTGRSASPSSFGQTGHWRLSR